MPRFVILEHDWPTPHWDLLFEAGPVLKAWRLLAEPTAGRTVPAEPNFDHRLLYLDYEGPVSNNRGTVHRHDSGTYDGNLERGELRLYTAAGTTGVLIERRGDGWVVVFV